MKRLANQFRTLLVRDIEVMKKMENDEKKSNEEF